jgi:NAD(P)-dependent dehydrogenase (short-subunit alcohol dehydrogenase family)
MEDKIIIVTGGNGLIGKSIVEFISNEGATALNLDINVNKDSATEIKCDITDPGEIESVVNFILKKYGRIDGLVNNAYPRTKDWGTPFENITPDSLRKNVDYQLNSYFIFCQKVLPVMKEQKSGSVVNIGSTYGVVGNDFTIYENTNMNPPSEYPAIKGGIINLTRYLASLYGKHNVRVNSVSPGGIFDHQPEPFVKAYEKRVPLKRMGNPDDIAPPVSFLLSEGAKYITGHNLMVDGGWTCI